MHNTTVAQWLLLIGEGCAAGALLGYPIGRVVARATHDASDEALRMSNIRLKYATDLFDRLIPLQQTYKDRIDSLLDQQYILVLKEKELAQT